MDINQPTNKPSFSIVYITPDMARRLLESNTRNRPVAPRIVATYARDMKDGNWQITGEGIKIATDGTLLDGQHRLHAIIKADTAVPMLVARGIPNEAQGVMDTGRKRTAADALSIAGEKNAAIIASAAKLALEFNPEAREFNHYGPSHAEVTDFVASHPGLRDSADAARKYARHTDCPPSVVAFTHWWLSRYDAADATRFWRDASEKVGLAKGDPVIALTNRLSECRRQRQTLSKTVYVSLILRAWNARRNGESRGMLRVNSPKTGGIVPIPQPI